MHLENVLFNHVSEEKLRQLSRKKSQLNDTENLKVQKYFGKVNQIKRHGITLKRMDIA